jgi:peptidoglycan hydrolase-like protein with peptidoglycan-binding domain
MRNTLLWVAVYTGCVSSVIIFLMAGGAVPLQTAASWVAREVQTASIFFVQSTTSAQIQNTYTSAQSTVEKKARILIVPGHRPDYGGTEFGGVYERDIVVDIANELATLLAQNPHLDVMVARSKTIWNPILQSYFDIHAADIEAFIQSQKAQMATHLANGSFSSATNQVYHNSTSALGALQLFGINKWANENKIDITLHLHINDDAERRVRRVGKYSGFAVYVPDRQYSNAEASQVIGAAIATRLSVYHATSTLPKEDEGVVEDQELIAIGANNTADNASLLIEYGYIYEPQFQVSSVLPTAVTDYAYQTYLGLQDFFNNQISSTHGSLSFPTDWTTVTGKKNESGADVYALQAALRYLGHYPPNGKSFSDCPISGKVGSCTRSAIKAYQSAQSIEATGFLGPKTRAALEQDLLTP